MAQHELAALHQTPLTATELARAEMVDFTVDRNLEIPVGAQLLWKLRAMIARGALVGGDRLPSVRELAEFSGVNVNTARTAYDALEREGLAVSEQGRGSFVADSGARPDLASLVAKTLSAAGQDGIDVTSLAEAIWAAGTSASAGRLPPAPLPEVDPADDAATLRRELRAQISRIEAELAPYAWHDAVEAPPQRVETAEPVGRLPSVEDLQRTRDSLIGRLLRLRDEAARRGVDQQRAREHVESMLEDPSSHRWEVVTASDVGAEAGSWRVVPRFGPLGAILGWWRVKSEPE